jgi:multidrug resistance efflux pump
MTPTEQPIVQAAAPDDDVAVMREILRQAFWDLAYHEAQLPKAHRNMANRRALLERAGMVIELRQAQETFDAVEEEGDIKDANQYAAWLLADAAQTIAYHEKELTRAHIKLANAKALMRRANLDLPLADIEAKAHETDSA